MQNCAVLLCCQAPKNYATYGSGDADDEGDEEEEGPTKGGSKKRSSKKASGSARQQLTGFEGCATLFGDTDIYPAYQQGRCQAFHSGEHRSQFTRLYDSLNGQPCLSLGLFIGVDSSVILSGNDAACRVDAWQQPHPASAHCVRYIHPLCSSN